jgi:CHAT domain-containing protein
MIQIIEEQQLSDHNHRPRLHWCPTGIFSTLPLHAAGVYHGSLSHKVCCADFVVSSYTPTLTTLLRTQRATIPLRRSDLSISLIAEKRAQDTTLPVIYDVDREIELVAAVANSHGVNFVHERVGLTTVEDTSRVMQAASIVHLACHGIQDTHDATQSGFCLGDGRLTIAKLMELKLDNAFLAFLSACETAKGDQEQPDQAMHLAAAMLFSGFKSVVATMWYVNRDSGMSECLLTMTRAICDVDGPKVAKWFYEELLARQVVDVDSVAYALDSAVGHLRASGVSPERWAPFIHVGA